MRNFWTLSVIALAVASAGCTVPDQAMVQASMDRYASTCSSRKPPCQPQAHRPLPHDGRFLLAELGEQPVNQVPGQTDQAQPFVPWRQRVGPAYPGDFWRSFGRDGKEFVPILWDDTKATASDPWSLGGLAVAGITGIALHGKHADSPVARHYRNNGSQLNTFWDSVGDVGGNPATHFGLAGAAYLYTLATGDVENYEKSKTMLNALALTGITTVALKIAANTESPNGDGFGWPSGHTSSSFALATVLCEEYGPWIGIPAFGFAAFVGYERIDARNHDFSDVISGAFLGMAIAHAVVQNHKARILGMELVPFVDPQRNAVGIALVKQW